MNIKHTSGPWEMRGPCEIKGNYSVIHNGPLFYVGDAGQPEGTGEANARLTAASPELLEALRDLLNATEETYDSRHEREAARAAIAKATGSNT
jgi:hypothetical protein